MTLLWDLGDMWCYRFIRTVFCLTRKFLKWLTRLLSFWYFSAFKFRFRATIIKWFLSLAKMYIALKSYLSFFFKRFSSSLDFFLGNFRSLCFMVNNWFLFLAKINIVLKSNPSLFWYLRLKSFCKPCSFISRIMAEIDQFDVSFKWVPRNHSDIQKVDQMGRFD